MTLSVDAQLVHNIPAFFQSLEEALAEHLQNAYRAGATYLEIQINPRHDTITLTDDGSGIADPSALFTAGRSAWSEPVSSWKPAGMGFFAWFAFAESVVIETQTINQGWQATVTHEHLTGQPFTIDPLRDRVADGHGTRMTIRLTQPAPALTNPRHWKAWRHRFPLRVTVNGQDVAMRLPPEQEKAAITIRDVGTLHVFDSTDLDLGAFVAQWEHRLVHQDPLILTATDMSPKAQWAREIIFGAMGVQFLWELTPTTGLVPKLPDRREWHITPKGIRAIEAFLEGLADYLGYDNWTRLQDNPPTAWPDSMWNFEIAIPPDVAEVVDSWPFPVQPETIVKTLMGYIPQSVTDTINFYSTYDGVSFYSDSDTLWVRPDRAVWVDNGWMPQAVGSSDGESVPSHWLLDATQHLDKPLVTPELVINGPLHVLTVHNDSATWRLVMAAGLRLRWQQHTWELSRLASYSHDDLVTDPEWARDVCQIPSWDMVLRACEPTSQALLEAVDARIVEEPPLLGTLIIKLGPEPVPAWGDLPKEVHDAIVQWILETAYLYDETEHDVADDTDGAPILDDMMPKIAEAWQKAFDPTGYMKQQEREQLETHRAHVMQARAALHAVTRYLSLYGLGEERDACLENTQAMLQELQARIEHQIPE